MCNSALQNMRFFCCLGAGCGKWLNVHRESCLFLQFGGEVYVPKIEKELTTQRIMVMEWIDGVKVTSESQIKEMGCVAPAANSIG
jgi:hypothetical protein